MIEEPSVSLMNLDVVFHALEMSVPFLEMRGFTKEANSSNSLLDDLAKLRCSPLIVKQTSITT